jgi:hypothetical protein
MNLVFEPLDIGRQLDYGQALTACPQKTSDYAFANVWGWGEHYGLTWAFGHGLAWLAQTRGESALWAPVGDWEGTDWRALAPLLSGRTFIRVPERLALLWREAFGGAVALFECRDHFDYVYSVPELVGLKGNRFHKKKNLLAQFQKQYAFEYKPLTPECVEDVLQMQADWQRWHEVASEALVAENRAIERVLTDFDRITCLTGGTIRINGRVAAYCVAECLGQDSLVIHFEKGDTAYKGVYQAINQMFLAHAGTGFAYVNREQDLGDAGLRKAKLSYNPVLFLKKFKAVFRRAAP